MLKTTVNLPKATEVSKQDRAQLTHKWKASVCHGIWTILLRWATEFCEGRCYDHGGRDRIRRLPMVTAVVRGCLRQAVCLRQPWSRQLATDEINLSKVQCQGITPVFFNLFVAAEPWTSVEVTQGTPCALIRWVQRHTRGWSYGVSTDSFP